MLKSPPANGSPLIDDLVEAVAQRAAQLVAERPSKQDRWIRGADKIADYIDAPRSRVYALAACNPPRLPIHRDGSALVAKASELDAWIVGGGGIRP